MSACRSWLAVLAVGVMLGSGTDLRAAILTHWTFENNGNDTATGGATTDNLTAIGTIGYTGGVVGRAMSLASGYLSANDANDLDLNTAAWTMECFIKDGLGSAGWKRLVWKWDPGAQIHWALLNNKFDLYVNGASVIPQAGQPLNTAHWHHLAMANSAATGLKAWVDGALVYSGAAITVINTASPFCLGYSGAQFTGLVDEFIIHDEAKDQAYVRSRAALLPAELAIEYKFENSLSDTATEGAVADTLSARNNANAIITPPANDYETGLVGKALRLGQNSATRTQWVGAADGADADVPPCYTLEAFIRPDVVTAGGFNRVMLHWTTPDTFHLAVRDGKASIFHGQAGGAAVNVDAGTIRAGHWYHLAVTANPADTDGGSKPNGTVRLWLNGYNVGKVAYDGTVANSANLIFFGSSTADSPFTGLIDEVRVHHNVARSQAYMQERAALMLSLQPAAGLLAYYPFENNAMDAAPRATRNSGAVADDLAPVGGAVTFEAGKVEIGARLNGAYLAAPHSSDIVLPNQFTIEAWVKADNPAKGWNRLVLNWGGGQMGYHFALRDGDVDLFINQANNAQLEARANIAYRLDTGWHHVAGVTDGTAVRVYCDGLEVGSTTYNGTIFQTATEGLALADSAGGPDPTGIAGMRFAGLIDEVALWGVALPPGALAAHWARGPVGYDLVRPPSGTLFVVR